MVIKHENIEMNTLKNYQFLLAYQCGTFKILKTKKIKIHLVNKVL
jgi:hypothetical protein